MVFSREQVLKIARAIADIRRNQGSDAYCRPFQFPCHLCELPVSGAKLSSLPQSGCVRIAQLILEDANAH